LWFDPPWYTLNRILAPWICNVIADGKTRSEEMTTIQMTERSCGLIWKDWGRTIGTNFWNVISKK